tara:strand:- start:44 stop:376 length:333 start_codon:yes stop_codon:yes gene_type:complete
MNEDVMGRKNFIAGAFLLFVIGASFVVLNFDNIFGDDDMIYYCSNDGEDYAESMGGISCPEGPGIVPMCPNDELCVCIDVDDSCEDGDDDWGYYADKTPEDEEKEEKEKE